MTFALSSIELSSTAFGEGQTIPVRHTQEGDDVSPELAWRGAPEGTGAYVVVCHDPDAPLVQPVGAYGFVHWVLYDIPGSVTSLSEGMGGYTSGKNDAGSVGYAGPMPPNGHGVHRYYFWILALSEQPQLAAGLTLWELLVRIEPYVLGMNRLVGHYERP